MMGYYKNPDAAKETMTEDGFLKSGDIGEIDSIGRLHQSLLRVASRNCSKH
jgi:long-chain acyl-CoA synthetase